MEAALIGVFDLRNGMSFRVLFMALSRLIGLGTNGLVAFVSAPGDFFNLCSPFRFCILWRFEVALDSELDFYGSKSMIDG